MTRQETFNTVKEHLLRQNAKSQCPNPEWRAADPRAGGDFACSYRGDNGTKCAIGCLIADEHYSPGLEGWGILQTTVEVAVCKSLGIPSLDIEDLRLLQALQQVHDLDAPERWPVVLDSVERNYVK